MEGGGGQSTDNQSLDRSDSNTGQALACAEAGVGVPFVAT